METSGFIEFRLMGVRLWEVRARRLGLVVLRVNATMGRLGEGGVKG